MSEKKRVIAKTADTDLDGYTIYVTLLHNAARENFAQQRYVRAAVLCSAQNFLPQQ